MALRLQCDPKVHHRQPGHGHHGGRGGPRRPIPWRMLSRQWLEAQQGHLEQLDPVQLMVRRRRLIRPAPPLVSRGSSIPE